MRLELLSAEQVAEMLHRKVGGIKKAYQRGQLAFPAKTRRPLTFRRSDVERWIEQNTTLR